MWGLFIGGLAGAAVATFVALGKEENTPIINEPLKPQPDSKLSEQIKNKPDEIASHLKMLADLKNDGILTEEEFQMKKKELLDRF